MEVMPYKCNKCMKEFSQKSHYTKHKKKKYLCTSEEKVNSIIKEGKTIKTELVLQKPDGKRVWERKTENELKDENKNTSLELQSAFDKLIKSTIGL